MANLKALKSPLALATTSKSGFEAANSANSDQITFVPVDRIRPNPFQHRTVFFEDDLKELADDIRRNGILEPLMGRTEESGTVTLVFGERRLRAAKLLGLREVPLLLKNLSNEELESFGISENLKRTDLHPIDEITMLSRQVELHGSQQAAAEALGMTREKLAQKVRFAKLDLESRQVLIAVKELKFSHLRGLAGFEMNSPEQKAAIGQLILKLSETSLAPTEPIQEKRKPGGSGPGSQPGQSLRVVVRPEKGQAGPVITAKIPAGTSESVLAMSITRIVESVCNGTDLKKEVILGEMKKALR